LRHDLRLENGGETSAGCHNGEPLVSTPYFSRFYCLDSWVHYTITSAAKTGRKPKRLWIHGHG